MTINELIAELFAIPEDKRDLPIYVCNTETVDNFQASSVSLYDPDATHDEDNPLGIDFTVPSKHPA